MRLLLLCLAACLLASVMPASAGTYEFTPSPDNLQALDHYSYAVWGINWTLPQGEVITSAKITFYNLYNYDAYDYANIMYVHLLNSAPVGAVQIADYGIGDHFAAQGRFLGSYHDNDGPAHKTDKSFSVAAADFSWLADGNFGFGIDPDCHFYDSNVKVKIETECVPEPAPLIALCCGLSGMLGFVRRRRRA